MLAWFDVGSRAIVGRATQRAALVWTGAALGVAAGACNVEPGPQPQFAAHCKDEAGDATCAFAYPSRPYCNLCKPVTQNEGCDPSPPPPACSPGGGPIGDDGVGTSSATDGPMDSSTGPSVDDTTSSDLDTSSLDDTGTDSSSTGPTLVACETDDALDEACEAIDATRPFCVSGACTDCSGAGGDGFCGEIDGATPACDLALGTCVACFSAVRPVCDGTTPICDADGGACVACTEHTACDSGACHNAVDDPERGRCFDGEVSVWVDGTQACPGSGTETDPLCRLADAMASLEAGSETVIHLVAGDAYEEDIVFDQVANVAIVGVGQPLLNSHQNSNDPTLVVDGGGTLYLAHVRLNNNELSHALRCDAGLVAMDDGQVAGNTRWGVYGTGPCTIELRRTNLFGNADGGIRMLGGLLRLDNAAVGENGDGASGPGIQLLHADIDAVYATIAGNDGFGPDSLQCQGIVSGTVRNSIVNGPDDETVDLDCFSLEFDNNAINSGAFGGGTNVEIEPYTSIYFSDPEDGDFRLSAPPLTPYGDVAQWTEGDPRSDADGTERPTDGPGYAGVDQPG